MNWNRMKGFTLVEMLVVITIIGILAVLVVPNITKAMNKAREAECKANMHSIEVDLNRYYTQEKQYPAYIAGGNSAAWAVFHQKAKDGDIDTNLQYLVDPLIEKGYTSRYPQNPFVDHEAGIELVRATSFAGVPNLGDPRFGDQGDTMGNVLDDPRFYDNSHNPGDYAVQFYNSRGAGLTGMKLPYTMGGFFERGKYMLNFWPGEFFYRAIGELDLQQSNVAFSAGQANLWDLPVASFDNYIMGVYGAEGSKGIDVIRLTGNGNYVLDPNKNFPFTVPLAIPEVMGGGSNTVLPVFPYKDPQGNLIFGAPDGYDDGIIYCVSGSGWTKQR